MNKITAGFGEMKFDELFMKDEVRVVTRVHGIQ